MKGVDTFFDWLREEFPDGVVLVAHAGFGHDAPIIVRDLIKSGWSQEQIQETIVGFVDTQVAFQQRFKGTMLQLSYMLLTKNISST